MNTLMRRSFFILIILLFLSFAAWPSPMVHATPSAKAESMFRRARSEYVTLLKSPGLQKRRRNWLNCIGLVENFYRSFPESEKAPEALYMTGVLYENLNRYSGDPFDLELAISAYQRLTILYPLDHLAEDGQYRLGEIHLKNGDYERAYASFSKVKDRFPTGKRVPDAERRLALIRPHLPTEQRGVEIRGIRYWSNSEYTRVVIDLKGETKSLEHLIREDRASGKTRLRLDIQPARIRPELSHPITIQNGLLTTVSAEQYSKDLVRVVLDMKSLGTYRSFSLDDPPRFVIDAHEVKQEPVSGAVGTPVRKGASVARQSSPGNWRIVIDPGHGGDDPGAIGPGRLMEKDVVLRIAKKLRDKLKQEPGCQPILTRQDDTFIPLDERTAIANTQKADIFVSIHANASPNLKTRGIETYLLNFTTNRKSMELAARENAVSTRKLTDLQYILYDLRRTEKINGSRRLAELVQHSICNGLAESYSQVCNLGVKEAPFYVLFGADMPSILIEVSFISNQLEERRLNDDKYLDRLVEAIKQGIVHYMKGLGNYPAA